MISTSLSPEARRELINFVEAYIDTLLQDRVNLLADIAKAQAIAALRTDIDILVFVDTVSRIKNTRWVRRVAQGEMTSREAAIAIVELSDLAHKVEAASRGNKECFAKD